VEDMIKSANMVWPGYYRNAGTMQVISSKPENTVIHILDFPEMDPAHCRLMEGWISSAVIVLGGKLIQPAKEVECMSRGGPYHEFVLGYSK